MTDEGLGILSRRDLGRIVAGGSAAFLIEKAHAQSEAKDTVTPLQAINGNFETRKRYISQIQGKLPDEVALVQLADNNVMASLKPKYNYDYNPRVAYALAITLDMRVAPADAVRAPPEQLGKGPKSNILVFDSFFDRLVFDIPLSKEDLSEKNTRQLNKELGTIMKNRLVANMFSQARYFGHGVPGYSMEDFRETSGRMNFDLYTAAIAFLSLGNEYQADIADPNFSSGKYIRRYAGKLAARQYQIPLVFLQFATPFTKPQVVERLMRDLHPVRLFPAYKQK